jgi:hypothetical protein
VLLLLARPAPARADAGIPMIVLTFPPMLMSLVPVILLEAALLSRILKLGFKASLPPAVVANAVSTVIGFPLSWFLMLALELLTTGGGTAWGIASIPGKVVAVTLQAAWLIPYEKELWWMIPAAAAFGLVPAYFISVFIEAAIVRRYFRQETRAKLRAAVVRANLASYALLACLCLGIFLYQFVRNR